MKNLLAKQLKQKKPFDPTAFRETDSYFHTAETLNVTKISLEKIIDQASEITSLL